MKPLRLVKTGVAHAAWCPHIAYGKLMPADHEWVYSTGYHIKTARGSWLHMKLEWRVCPICGRPRPKASWCTRCGQGLGGR